MADRDLRGRTLGEFVLGDLLGRGGYGDVYRATQPRLARSVVVKVLRARDHASSSAEERFQREAQLAALIDHDNAAHIYASGTEDEDGLLWIAMELVPGTTLDHCLAEDGPMRLEQLVPLLEQLADVVDYAHARGIVHRDLKPANVMVLERGGKRIAKLLDLGIAKASDEVELLAPTPWLSPEDRAIQAESRADGGCETVSAPPRGTFLLTRSGDVLGSAPYMSPEQWRQPRTVGPAADIYALGVLAYKALTGRVPFTAESHDDYRRHHLHSEVPPLGGDYPAALDQIFARALAKKPEDRYRTAQDLAAALRATLRTPEMIRAASRHWDDNGRAPGLLWSGPPLAAVERWTRGAPSGELRELDRSFLGASQRRARRRAWSVRLAGALAVVSVFAVFQYRAAMQTRLAERITEATITQAELEQGRSAVLHGEPEAQIHLAEAYKRDRSPSTAFMLARALQPRLTEQARFASSFGRMWSATFSPDGRQIVTTDDRGAQIWDAQSYRLLARLPHRAEVYHALYSADGTRLVTVAQDAVRIWNPTTGTLLHELTQRRSDGNAADYYLGAMSFDGRFVSAIDSTGAVAHVWDATSGAPLAELKNDALLSPRLAFSSDGHWLATTGGNDVHVFDTQTWRTKVVLRGPHLNRLGFDPTGPRLVTGATTGDAAIWEIPSGTKLHHLRELGEPVDAVAFSPDGQLVVAASRDGALQVWHADSGELQSQLNPRRSKILAVEFDRSSKLVLTAGADGTVVVADAMLGTPITELEGPQNVVWSAHFDPSSRRVVGASWDGTARVWDATPPYRRWSSSPVSDNCGIVASAEPDRRFIAVGCRGHATRVWDTARDELIAELPSVSHVAGDFATAFPAVSAAGDRAAIARGNAVELYELPGGRLLRSIAHGAAVNTVAFASTGRDVISGAVDGSVLVTRDNGAQLAIPATPGGIDAVAILADDRIVVADAQRRMRFYDRGGEALADLVLPTRVMSLRIDGQRLVTIPMYTGTVGPPLLVDLERYRVVTWLAGHVGAVNSARWVAPNRILTAGSDGTARMWDGTTGQLRQIYRGGARLLVDATLSPDGALVMAGGGDGVLRFWDRASGRQLWTLQAHKSHLIGIHIEGGDIVTRGFTGELSRWTLPGSEQVIEACGDHERCAIVAK